MNNKMPRTPFSTGLSKSAKETELRIRNIFSGPKRRPPLLLIVCCAAIWWPSALCPPSLLS